MPAMRQDAWTEEDDLILAETTLRHIREGSTQLAAFDEVGEKIGRTGAACGFRWNSYVRKKYEDAIQLAKAQRQKRNQMKKQASSANSSVAVVSNVEGANGQEVAANDGVSVESMSIEAVIRFLRYWKSSYQEMSRQIKALEKELQEKQQELKRLQEENEKLNKQVSEVETDYRVVNDDYRALIQIMDRARKMAFLMEEEDGNKSRFKMDLNGNLERID